MGSATRVWKRQLALVTTALSLLHLLLLVPYCQCDRRPLPQTTRTSQTKPSFVPPTVPESARVPSTAVGRNHHQRRQRPSTTGRGALLNVRPSALSPLKYVKENQDNNGQAGSTSPQRQYFSEESHRAVPWGFIWSAALAILISYADRGNLATCILPMSESLHWTLGEQSLVLSSFFAGYAITQVIGGTLADRYGGERVLEAGVLFWSVLTLLTPWAASMGIIPAILVRIGLGLGEGVAFPAVHAMIPSYVPVERRSLAVAIVTAASYVGAMAAFAFTPLIIQQAGWPSVFYGFGSLPVLWFPIWWVTRGQRLPSEGRQNDALQAPAPPPAPASEGALTWSRARLILQRKEVLAILIAQYAGSWGLYGLLSWLPTYFSKTYGVDVASLGTFTVGPYVAQALVGVVSGSIADTLIARGWRVRTVRKALQVVGSLLPALFLLLATTTGALSSASTSLTSSFLYLTIGAAFSALTLAAVSVNHLDVCPRHAGFVFGAGNTLATLAGLISVPVSGLLLERTGSFTAVFACFAAHYVVGALLYAWLAGDEDVTKDPAFVAAAGGD